MTESSAYTYKLDVFEGPLDLLLHLIEKNKVDIYDIPIVSIADQYTAYIHAQDTFDMEYGAAFLVMAATLLQIKSRMLLPRALPQAEEEEDPRDELVKKLIEFKRIKEIAEDIGRRAVSTTASYARLEETSQWGTDTVFSFDIRALESVFTEICARKMSEETAERPSVTLERDALTVEAVVASLRMRAATGERIAFRRLFDDCRTKEETVVTFIALLELLKRGIWKLVSAEGEDPVIEGCGEEENIS